MSRTDPSHQTQGEGAILGTVDTSYYLIAVGASAGGLDAIKAFLGQVPENCRHSFIFLQHISPDHKSLMKELLERETSLKVVEVEDDLPLLPGHVYTVSPKANVIIKGTNPLARRGVDAGESLALDEALDTPRNEQGLRFSLIEQPPRPKLNFPIDLFFESVAEAVRDRAVAIILSGTGSDGSRSLRTIKDAEGVVMVQEPSTAAFDGMPSAAIATQLVDFVLPPDEMMRELQQYFRLRESGGASVESIFAGSEKEFESILAAVSEVARIDFSQYKSSTLQRRIARRMVIRKCHTLEQYEHLVAEDPEEAAVLHREFLVGVTHFFRDLPAWDALGKEVLPKLFASDDDGDEPIRVWSVGCSTGEEAYTIAMFMEEFRRRAEINRDFRIFATDVDPAAISVAKEGLYPPSALEDISPEYVDRYVTYGTGGIQVARELRKKLIFSVHNALEDPPFIRSDLIVCRNMMIYVSPPMQSQLLATFAYSLLPRRFLFLGASEGVERALARFRPLDKRWRIFQNANKMSNRAHSFPPFLSRHSSKSVVVSNWINEKGQSKADTQLGFLEGALEGLGASVIVVDPRMHVVETYGDYRRYMTLPKDSFSARLPDLVPPRLATSLSLLVNRASKGEDARLDPIRVSEGDELRELDLYCRKFVYDDGAALFAIVLRQSEIDLGGMGHRISNGASGGTASPEQTRYILELESELEATRETLETTVEDLGVANEELQTSNEELMSTNEELQAANEEMQSVNEELHTVNAERAEKIGELESARADIENFLNSTDIASVFLDLDLRIRHFSSSIKGYFHLGESDIGRPLAHFSSSLRAEDNHRLLTEAKEVLKSGELHLADVESIDGQYFQARIRPYANLTGVTAGVVLSFVDITQVNRLKNEIKERNQTLEAVLESELAGYFEWNLRDETCYLSPRYKQLLGYADDEIENTVAAAKALVHPDDLPAAMEMVERHIESRCKVPYDIELRYLHKSGATVWVWSRGTVIQWDESGKPVRFVGGHVDISGLKDREAATLERAEEIRRFAFISSHDLREPLSTIESYVELLEGELGDPPSDSTRHLMDVIRRSSQRMRKQVEGVLEYAKLRDGEPEFEVLDMAVLVRESVDALKTSWGKEPPEIDLGTLPEAWGSRALIGRVVQILIANSIKFQPPGQVAKVWVTGSPFSDNRVAFSISDNGVGIAREYRDQVFGLFSRLHARTEYEGAGLGLALCKRIMELHGGRIWVEEPIHGGTTIMFAIKRPGREDDN